MKIDLSKLSLDELKKLSKDVQTAIGDFEERKRREAREKVEQLAKSLGYSADELLGAAGAKRGRKAKAVKGVAKFRNPANPDQTWTGRGRRPDWVNAALAEGKALDDLKA